MDDFGPKRPMPEDAPCASEGVEKAKRGRPKKKPDYDRDKEIEAFQARAVELFGEPYDDRIERSEDAPSIRDVAAAMDTTPLRVRKMLVTAGVYSTRLSREVQKLYEEGYTIQQIMDETGLRRSSVHAYLPYVKGNYCLPESTLNAERRRVFRKRVRVSEQLMQNMDSQAAEQYLWDAIEAYADYSFRTEKGLSMKYTVKGGEIFFDRKEKSVTRSSVMKAFHRARQLQQEKGFVSGPKELGTFGASYLYPVFLRLGVCKKKPEIF